jgi:hypothetical protein
MQELTRHINARDRALELSVPYMTLLMYVSSLARDPAPRAVQFALMYSPGERLRKIRNFCSSRDSTGSRGAVLHTLHGLADVDVAIAAVVKLAGVAAFVSGLEYLLAPQLLRDEGLQGWRVAALRRARYVGPRAASICGILFRYPNVLALVGSWTVLSGLLVVAPTHYGATPWVLLPLVICLGLAFFRNNYGHDGADQLVWLTLWGLLPVSLVGSREAESLYLWFVAVQVCLAYAVAGVAKASSQTWRKGTVLVGILGTEIYGNRRIARALAVHPTLATLQARFIIIFECSFAGLLLMPLQLVAIWLLAGLAFHIFNAYAMGLNSFVWSFAAGYPAVVHCVMARGW